MWFKLILTVVSVSLISIGFNILFFFKIYPIKKIVSANKLGRLVLPVLMLTEGVVYGLVSIFLKFHVLFDHFEDSNVQLWLGCMAFFLMAPTLFFTIYIAGLWSAANKK
jgi:hypothetical protein